jgi:hypothetical protein
MLRNLFATLLVTLTVLPFTAPFPAFDLTHGSSPSHTASLDDGSHALPTLAASARTRTRFASQLAIGASTGRPQAPAVYVDPHSKIERALSLRSPLSALRI